ncbi:phage minor tail protein G [Brenneria populi subsp. brevivirga]|uniref:phage tail assembly chaperone G n=1 Tax=Brenneria populi TaxID=1505588 RepID=UPI002E18CB21|nr:phage minor tail protein G [Brenneria populi subsp. brevivirga]
MFLKKEPFPINGETVTLYQLSGLQRIEHLEYLEAKEKLLSDEGQDNTKTSAALISFSIHASVRVVALSISNDKPDEDIEVLHQDILRTWPLDAIGEADQRIKKMSGMISDAPEQQEEGGEPVSLEKP